MLRGPLGNNKYKPKFSGHDTFPFRYAWLTKLVHYLEDGNKKKIKEILQLIFLVNIFDLNLLSFLSFRNVNIKTRYKKVKINILD